MFFSLRLLKKNFLVEDVWGLWLVMCDCCNEIVKIFVNELIMIIVIFNVLFYFYKVIEDEDEEEENDEDEESVVSYYKKYYKVYLKYYMLKKNKVWKYGKKVSLGE